MQIVFRRDYGSETLYGVTFWADVDGKEVTCVVSAEALTAKYKGSLKDAEALFLQNRADIEAIARSVIQANPPGENDDKPGYRLDAVLFGVVNPSEGK